ncbi:MAG: PilZ domain-containing protein [Nitrospiraceae bacterium]
MPGSRNGGAELVEYVIKENRPMEKRKCPRFPVMLPAVFFGERAGGGLVVDVSLEGCRIQSAVPIQKGDYVRIRIDLIGDTMTGDLAVVRWSRKKEFGVELIRMAPDQQDRLHGFLNLFSHTPGGASTTAATDGQ